MASGCITSWETVADFIFGGSKITADGDCSHEIKRLTLWKESYDQPRQHIEKQRHYFANKGLSSQGYGFFSSHVWMWELYCEESWAPKNWCFWTVVLEKTFESPFDSRRSNQSILKEINPRCSLEGLMLKLKLQYFGHLMQRADSLEKTLMLGGIGGRRRRGRQRMRWLDGIRLDGCEFEWTPGIGDGQGGLVCCDSWGRKELDTTERLNWTELSEKNFASFVCYNLLPLSFIHSRIGCGVTGKCSSYHLCGRVIENFQAKSLLQSSA